MTRIIPICRGRHNTSPKRKRGWNDGNPPCSAPRLRFGLVLARGVNGCQNVFRAWRRCYDTAGLEGRPSHAPIAHARLSRREGGDAVAGFTPEVGDRLAPLGRRLHTETISARRRLRPRWRPGWPKCVPAASDSAWCPTAMGGGSANWPSGLGVAFRRQGHEAPAVGMPSRSAENGLPPAADGHGRRPGLRRHPGRSPGRAQDHPRRSDPSGGGALVYTAEATPGTVGPAADEVSIRGCLCDVVFAKTP